MSVNDNEAPPAPALGNLPTTLPEAQNCIATTCMAKGRECMFPTCLISLICKQK